MSEYECEVQDCPSRVPFTVCRVASNCVRSLRDTIHRNDAELSRLKRKCEAKVIIH